MTRALALFGMALATLGASLAIAGCGSGDPASSTSTTFANRAAPPPSDFPSATGRSLAEIAHQAQPSSDLVVAPASSVFARGENRFAFGVFTVSRKEVPDTEVALYVAPHNGGPAAGPFPARAVSLAVDPRYQSLTTSQDPDAAHLVYVSNVEFTGDGPWDVLALIRRGSSMEASVTPTVEVGADAAIPQVGQVPPRVSTPTVKSVGGDVTKIDTRNPPDDMHSVDFAKVLGKQPVVLLFATPALCQSRVCGPVVDVAEQVSHEAQSKGVDFIHMEVYKGNDANKGLRPQLRAFHLRTEPWLFVIGRDGRISTRIEGAFGVNELEAAVQKVAGAG